MSATTVFISYRREPIASAIAGRLKQSLTYRNYNVFLDVDQARAGKWAERMRTEVQARSHFLLLLTPGSLDRCVNEHDCVREEFELALSSGRNIVPVCVGSAVLEEMKQQSPESMKSLFEYAAAKLRSDEFEGDVEDLVANFIPPDKTASPQTNAIEPSKEEVCKYLQGIVNSTNVLPAYYPARLRNSDEEGARFSRISQRIQVLENPADFERWLLAQRDRLAKDPTSILAYSPYRSRPETYDPLSTDNELTGRFRVFQWNADVSNLFGRAVIFGDPGFGKSWLLRYEARRIAEEAIDQLLNREGNLEELFLPISVQLFELALVGRPDDSLTETLALLASERNGDNPFPEPFYLWVKTKIRAGKCSVLLDGWDEVPAKSRGLTHWELAQKIEKFSQSLPAAKLLVTSRILGYRKLAIANAKELCLIAFERSQIESFVAVWFAAEPDKRDEFLELLNRQPQVGGLARIPLMLSLQCRLFDTLDGPTRFPKRRVELYEACLRGLLKDWKEEREKTGIDDVDDLLEVLGALAYELFARELEHFNRSTLRKILVDCLNALPESNALKNAKVTPVVSRLERDGILIKTNEDSDPQLLFLHRTFYEYLAASGLAKRNAAITSALSHVYDARWQEVLRLLGGLLESDTEAYLNALRHENNNDLFYRPLKLAVLAACEVAEFPGFVKAVMNEAVDVYLSPPKWLNHEFFADFVTCWGARIVSKLIEGMGPEVGFQKKELCATALARLHVRDTIPQLVRCLGDSKMDWRVRQEIALSLVRNRSDVALSELANQLHHARVEFSLLGLVVDQLAEQRVPAAVPLMISCLEDRRVDAEIRGHIAAKLAEMREAQAIRVLLAAVGQPELPYSDRAAVARELLLMPHGSIDAEQLKFLGVDLKRSKDAARSRHTNSAWTRETKSERSAGEPAESEQPAPPSPPDAQSVADKARAENQLWLTYLTARIEKTRNPTMDLVERMRRLTLAEALPALVRYLRDSDVSEWMRTTIVLRTLALNRPEYIPPLVEYLVEMGMNRRGGHTIALALLDRDVQAIVPLLFRSLRGNKLNRDEKETIVEELLGLKEPAIRQELLDYMLDGGNDIVLRSKIARSLYSERPEAAISTISEALKSEELRWGTRNLLVAKLGDIKDISALPILTQLLMDADDSLLSTIREALWSIATHHKIPVTKP